jgi:alcohol sulfotransferase
MSWSERLAGLPLVGSRSALKDVTRKLQQNKEEAEQLRARIEKQQRRLDEEKRRCARLERRLASAKIAKLARPESRSLTPHRQVFQSATPADGYRFATVVSYPKSGRTWFSTLYFHYARHLFGALDMPQQSLHMPDRNLAFQELLADKAKHGAFPVCVFTHLGFSVLKPFDADGSPLPDKPHKVLKRPCVLIVRDPRDVVVSHYHHLRAVGGVLDPDLSLSEFVHGVWGIERIVRFMNLWAEGLRTGDANLHLCTFEALKRDTAGTFAEAMRFLGGQVDAGAVAQAIEESRFDKLKDRERSSRTHSGRSLEPDAFRFRKGDIGGHARELSDADAAYLNHVVSTQLDPAFALYHSMLRD